MTLVDMIVPSRSKIANAAEPAVSLSRSFIVVGSIAALAPDGIHPADRRGDGWTVHFLDVGLPVEDRGVEGEGRLIIRMQRPGEREGVVVHEMQLGLRVLLVERVIAPQEIQAYAGAIQIFGELASPVRARHLGQHALGELVGPF